MTNPDHSPHSASLDNSARNPKGEWRPPSQTPYAPLFAWPPRPRTYLKWLFSYPGFLWPWNGLYLLITLGVWRFLQPPLSQCVELRADWIGFLYLRNLGLLWLVVGGWHLLLYIWKLQGTHRKYDVRWPSANDPKFLFRNQTYDNIFWSCVSGCSIWTAYEVLFFWAWANHWIPYVDWAAHPVYCVLWLCAIPFWREFHFYCIHRAIHWKPLYRYVHYLHHKNINPGPWSGLAMHPVEHILYLSVVLIHWVVPSHPIHLLFNSQMTAVFAPVTGHHGFEKPLLEKGLPSGSYFHYMHHRIFNCNYGGEELPLDRLFGTHHESLSRPSEK